MSYRVFPFTPEGSSPQLERISFSTEVVVSRNGTELCRPLRSFPRYRYELELPISALHGNGYATPLAELREQSGPWLLPLWPHAVPAGEALSTGANAEGSALWFNAAGQGFELAGAVPAEARMVVPAALGHVVEAVGIGHANLELASARVAVELLNHREVVAPYANLVGGVPVFDFPSDWSDGAEETLTDDVERLDFGGVWLQELRHRRREFSLDVWLEGPEAHAAFRSLLFAVKGRAGAFLWHCPLDPAPALWRLAADTVELSHVSPELRTSRLTFKRATS